MQISHDEVLDMSVGTSFGQRNAWAKQKGNISMDRGSIN